MTVALLALLPITLFLCWAIQRLIRDYIELWNELRERKYSVLWWKIKRDNCFWSSVSVVVLVAATVYAYITLIFAPLLG